MQTRRRSLVFAVVMLVAGVALAHADAVKDPKKTLIGTWQPEKEKAVTIEFQAAGKMVVTVTDPSLPKPMVVDGSYKWVDKDTIEVTLTDPTAKDAKPKTEKLKLAFDGADKMTATDSKGEAEPFTRKK